MPYDDILLPIFAGDSTFTAPALTDIISALNIQASDVLAVMASGITLCLGLCFAHWGAKKLARMFNGAFRRGKLRL